MNFRFENPKQQSLLSCIRFKIFDKQAIRNLLKTSHNDKGPHEANVKSGSVKDRNDQLAIAELY